MSAFLAFRNATFALLVPRQALLHRLRARTAYRTIQGFAVTPKTGGTWEKKGKGKKDKLKRPLRNKDIKHRIVQVVDPKSVLSEPTRLSDVLGTITDKDTFFQLISEVGPYPIVKKMSHKEEYDKQKLRKRKARDVAFKNRHKEIQLTWGCASNDSAHKLEKVRDELVKGIRVDLVFAPKKGQILPTPAERHAQIQEIVDMMAGIGKEWKPREEGRVTAVFLQGNALATPDHMISKVPKGRERKEERRAEDVEKKE